MFMLLDGLIVELRRLFERGLEILELLTVKLRGFFKRGLQVPDLLRQPVQEVVTFARISRP